MSIKRIKNLSLVSLITLGFICAGASFAFGKNKLENAKVQPDLTPQERAALAFYVYADFKSPLNHFYPSGWMGDTRDLAFDQSHTKEVFAGKTSIKVTYKPRGANKWAGIYWQQPANNWGDKQGGFELSKATFITFWMKGQTGNETISEVRIGGLKGAFPDSATAFKKNIKLTKNWKLYFIDLRGKDMSYIAGGFSFVVNKKDNPNGCTFYMDEIRYEMNK